MQAIWGRIEAWLETHLPELQQDLQPGASDDELEAVEQALGVTLPESMKASYKIHNGQFGDTAPLMGEWQLLALEDVQGQWELMQDLETRDAFTDSSTHASGSGSAPAPVRAVWWNSKWIPIAYNGAGDLLCVDLDPAPGGEAGQVIAFWHTEPERPLIASSFEAWLQNFADDLEQGNFIVEEEELVAVRQTEEESADDGGDDDAD